MRILRRAMAGAAGVLPFFVAAAATAIVVGLVAVLWFVFDDREHLRTLADNTGQQVQEVRRAADGAKAAAEEAKALAGSSQAVLSDRAAIVEEAVNHIQAALAAGIAAHDLNSHQDHEDLRRLLGVNAEPLPDRPPITAPATSTTRPAGPSASPTSSTTVTTTTTTTTCPKRGASDRCR